ncbi:MAG: hypothetical protein LBG96_03150, partial [Tannerella sp.]|nr:hypothetical protein [Tannerella sp.]
MYTEVKTTAAGKEMFSLAIKGYQPLEDCCAAKPVIVFGEMKGDSLSLFNNFNFLFMQETMKDASKVNNSSRTSTPTGATSVPYSKFLTEKNAKNTAYYFILSSGLYDQFS